VSPEQSLAAFLALTIVLLGCVVATGLKARRRWHITFVVLALASLVVSIVCARRVGKLYDLRSAGVITPVHLTLAKITTAAYLLPIATGLRTIFRPATRRLHRTLAFVVLGMTLVTAITGTMMLLGAKPIG
jgi:hypothetical protein